MMNSSAIKMVCRTLGTGRQFFASSLRKCAATAPRAPLRSTTEASPLSRCHSYYNHQRKSSSVAPRMFCFGGALAFLGLEPKKEDALTNTLKHGVLALQRKQYDKAEQFLHIALKMSQDTLNEQAVTYCYDLMANIAYERGDYPKAEKLFVETMKRAISSGTPADNNAIVAMSLKIATMNARQGIDGKAELGYKFCIDTQRKKVAEGNAQDENLAKDNHLLLGLSMDQYADYLLARARYSEAKKMWTEALSISRKFLGPEHEQSLVIRSNLALAHQRLGDIDEAVRILEEIVSLDGLEGSEDLPIFLCNLGMNYITQRKFQEAEKAFAKAQKLAEKIEDKTVLDEIAEYLSILRSEKEGAK